MLEAIRDGDFRTAVELPWEAYGWMAVDEAVQHVVNATALTSHAEPTQYPAPLYAGLLVTKENVQPDKSRLQDPAYDYSAYFTAKWKVQFALDRHSPEPPDRQQRTAMTDVRNEQHPQTATAVADPEPKPARTGPAPGALTVIRRNGVLIALAATIALFSVLRPELFPTLDNAITMLRRIAPLAIPAFGLTVVLVMNDFDLSLGAMVGLGGTAAVVTMSNTPIPLVAALACAIGLAVVIGILTGSPSPTPGRRRS